jgi:two-component system NarL family response regulator
MQNTEETKRRILLVDDHPPLREALRDMLRRDPELDVVGEAGDGAAALQLAQALRPDVVVMDIRMPGLNGVAALRQLLASHPGLKLIVLSATSERLLAEELLAAGARGYVVKADASELPRAIHEVLRGGTYLSTELMSRS